MHDHIAVVHQHPMGMIEPLDAHRPEREFLQGFFDLSGNGFDLGGIVGGADDEIISNGGQPGQSEHNNIRCLLFE